MSIWKKFIMAWKGRAVITQFSQISLGWRKLPFWISLIGSVISYLGALKEYIPPQYALLIGTALTAFYHVLRGLQQSDAEEVRPRFKTTEFWLGVAQQTQNALLAIQTGGLGTNQIMQANIVLTGAMAIARDLSNMQPNDGSVPLLPPEPPVQK